MKVSIKDYLLLIANKSEEAAKKGNYEEAIRVLAVGIAGIEDVIRDLRGKLRESSNDQV